ncbi:hypothetical protein BSL78_12056 [Apostichopus japonicus]|uniref:Ig-like domain-containing protein n=1 Tax=Stichopus japonicus TaxID=307972 RepID=A0A2G8KSS5_STIJA|nr:hypothetical protein BSL78_12056 [Apostichopus japonicus]
MANPIYILLTIFTVAAGSNCVVQEKEVHQIGSFFELGCERPRGDLVTTFLGPRGNDLLGNRENTHTERDGNAILRIQLKNFSDAGTYQCISDMHCWNKTIELFGITFPHMASEQRQTLNFRTEGVIKCTVMAQPQPIIEWSFNGLRLSNNHEAKQIDGSYFLIKKASFDNAGNYTCMAVLPGYNISRTLDIQVKVNEGQLRCVHCMKYTNNAKTASRDLCSLGSSQELKFYSCTTTCVTVVAFGMEEDGSENRFVLRDCGDEFSFTSSRDLNQSDLESLKRRYDVTSITAGTVAVCKENECNMRSATYDEVEEDRGRSNAGSSFCHHVNLKIIHLCLMMMMMYITDNFDIDLM